MNLYTTIESKLRLYLPALFLIFFIGVFTPKSMAQTLAECSVLKDSARCNAESGCFWTVKNANGYCTNGGKGEACRTAWCPSGYKCNQQTFSCDFQSCNAISNVTTCNMSAGCFWHLSSTVPNKGECVENPRGERVGADIYCRPNERIDQNRGLCVQNESTNNCEGVNNEDNAFKCMSNCTGDYSTTTSNTGVYSCGSQGGQCCKNQSIYNQRGNKPTDEVKPDTGTTGGGTRPQTTITPVDGTPAVPQGPATGPCAKEKGGVKEYVDAFCNKEPFEAAKAQDGKFCTATYSDKYICNNPDPATGKPYEDYFEVTSGTSPCSQAPWCPSASTQPNPGPDANCTAYQGQTCRPGDFSDSRMCCQPNKNLECVDPAKNGIYTCQYIGGAAFTPTPGAAGNCDGANFGMWGAGCACPAGGGCGPGLGCYPEASGAVFPPSNPNGYFCASSRWCANSQTDVSGAAACAKADTYVSPTPTPQSKAYQADCPSNPPGQHVCAATCPTGYAQKPGNVGNQICSEFSSGTTPLCCVRQAVAANTPTPYATTPPTPTPTRARQPLVPPSVPDCGADYQTWQSGTPCATATTCYDIYKNSSGASCYKMYSGQTCAHCAQ